MELAFSKTLRVVLTASTLCLTSPFTGTAMAESLRQAVTRALDNSNARQVAIQAIKAQNRQVAISQGERGATIDVFGEIGPEYKDDRTVSPANSGTELARQAGIGLSYPLWDGLRSVNQVYLDANSLDAEIIRLSDAAETISLNAVQAYVDVFRRRNIVAISEDNITVHVEIAEQVEQQVQAGRLSEPDRFQANDKLLAARLAHAEAKASLSDAVSNYRLVIGTAPQGQLRVPALSSVPSSANAVEQGAVQNSFLLRLAQKDIDAFDYREAIDAADWKPQVDAFLRGGIETDVDGSDGTEEDIAAGLRFTWTLYRGGTRENTIARIRDLKMRAYYRKKQVEDEVRNLARNSWNSYVAAVEQKRLLDTTVFNNEKIVEAFRQEVLAAKRPLLEVLDAERSLFNLRVRRANAEAAVAFQQYRMLAAQSRLARHFGLSPYGSNLSADFEVRARANPRNDFDITATPLE